MEIGFYNHHRGYHHGQHDFTLYAYLGEISDPDNVVTLGHVDYSIYQNEVGIQHVEVPREYQNQGIGLQLLQELVRETETPWPDIDLGYITQDGIRLVNAMNRRWRGQ